MNTDESRFAVTFNGCVDMMYLKCTVLLAFGIVIRTLPITGAA